MNIKSKKDLKYFNLEVTNKESMKFELSELKKKSFFELYYTLIAG